MSTLANVTLTKREIRRAHRAMQRVTLRALPLEHRRAWAHNQKRITDLAEDTVSELETLVRAFARRDDTGAIVYERGSEGPMAARTPVIPKDAESALVAAQQEVLDEAVRFPYRIIPEDVLLGFDDADGGLVGDLLWMAGTAESEAEDVCAAPGSPLSC